MLKRKKKLVWEFVVVDYGGNEIVTMLEQGWEPIGLAFPTGGDTAQVGLRRRVPIG